MTAIPEFMYRYRVFMKDMATRYDYDDIIVDVSAEIYIKGMAEITLEELGENDEFLSQTKCRIPQYKNRYILPWIMLKWNILDRMVRIYKEYLPAEKWDILLDEFGGFPGFTEAVVELKRKRAWERRRHALAIMADYT